MPYSNHGIGFNRDSYTSWLAAQNIKGKAASQRQKILGLYETGHGILCDGILGLASWHVKTYLSEMFAEGKSTSWTARLPDMVAKGELCKLNKFWVDPEGVKRELYFRAEDVSSLSDTPHPSGCNTPIQQELLPF